MDVYDRVGLTEGHGRVLKQGNFSYYPNLPIDFQAPAAKPTAGFFYAEYRVKPPGNVLVKSSFRA